MFDSFLKRFFVASAIWVVFWPLFWFIRIGDILGPKAWFWIVGELSYPFAAVAYFVIDSLCQQFKFKPWLIFVVAVLVVASAMPWFYMKYGFAWGVTIEARYL